MAPRKFKAPFLRRSSLPVESDTATGRSQMGARSSMVGGADFDRPPPLGDTDRSRYVKLTTLEEAQGREMHKWIKQAGRVTGWK
jgi:hypothetical protein